MKSPDIVTQAARRHHSRAGRGTVGSRDFEAKKGDQAPRRKNQTKNKEPKSASYESEIVKDCENEIVTEWPANLQSCDKTAIGKTQTPRAMAPKRPDTGTSIEELAQRRGETKQKHERQSRPPAQKRTDHGLYGLAARTARGPRFPHKKAKPSVPHSKSRRQQWRRGKHREIHEGCRSARGRCQTKRVNKK